MWEPHWARKFIKSSGGKWSESIWLRIFWLLHSTFFMSHFLGGDFYRKYFVKNPKIISPFFYVNFLNFLAHSGSDDNFLVGIIIEHSFTSLSTKSTREIRNCITALHLLINIFILLNMYISLYVHRNNCFCIYNNCCNIRWLWQNRNKWLKRWITLCKD